MESKDEAFESPGWVIGQGTPSVVTHQYTSTLGDPANANGKGVSYSRFRMQTPIEHPPIMYAKTFLVLLISTAIGFVSCLLPSGAIEARLGIGVASIFGIVSSPAPWTSAGSPASAGAPR